MVFHWPLNRFVITASTIGMVGSSVCIGLLINSQYKVLKKPYCQLALEELQKNQAALNLIGAPIQINRPDLIDKSQKFEASFTDIKVPFEGSKKKGMLHLVADRKIDDNVLLFYFYLYYINNFCEIFNYILGLASQEARGYTR